MLQFGTRLVNQTMTNPEARQWLPQGMDQVVGSVVDNAYAYGKTEIATLVNLHYYILYIILKLELKNISLVKKYNSGEGSSESSPNRKSYF